jgi:hypothetical protein
MPYILNFRLRLQPTFYAHFNCDSRSARFQLQAGRYLHVLLYPSETCLHGLLRDTLKVSQDSSEPWSSGGIPVDFRRISSPRCGFFTDPSQQNRSGPEFLKRSSKNHEIARAHGMLGSRKQMLQNGKRYQNCR